MISIRRLRQCSLPRLNRMHEAVSLEIGRLGEQVNTLEAECLTMAADENSVQLSEAHGTYQLQIDRIEEQIESTQRKIEDLEEKRDLIEEVRQGRHLRDEQSAFWAASFGSP